MTKDSQSTYLLRLPRSAKAEVDRRAKADGVSIIQFVATAVAEKLAAMNTAAFFAERRKRADFVAFDRLMRRKRGEVPPEPLAADIEAESRGRKISKSDVVRERLQLTPRQRRRRTASLDTIADLIGSVDGLPSDLSTRKRDYLRATGHGQKRPH